MKNFKWINCLCIVIFIVILSKNVLGQENLSPSPIDILLKQEIDSLMNDGLKKWHIPGASVAIVKSGNVWAKGYGFENMQSQTPVTANTVFRVASLSKLITATAALQLVEAGKINLHDDIRNYFKEKNLNLKFKKPVTLHQLLTHTGGFDRSDIGDATPDPEKLYDLKTLIEEHSTPQIHNPGKIYHYSNFGYSLIGYLVEQVSGLKFSTYVQQRIFDPLEMENSTFFQPQPPELRSKLAQAYYWNEEKFKPLPLDYSQVEPADAMISSADDMALFIKAQLQEKILLKQETLKLMHKQHYTLSPSPYGMAYGFQENFLFGRRVLEHSGVTLGYSSYILILPEEQLGIFISQNIRDGNLRWKFTQTVLSHYITNTAKPSSSLKPNPAYPIDASLYTGRYRHIAYPHHTFEKAAYVLGFRGSRANVKPADEGALMIDGQRFVASGPHMFTHPDQQHWTKGFVVNDEGKVIYHVSGREVLEKVLWWEHKRMIQLTLIFSILLGTWCFLVWPFYQRFYSESKNIIELKKTRLARYLLMGISAIWCVSIITFFIVMPLLMSRPIQFDYGPSATLIGLLTLILIAIIGGLIHPFIVFKSWTHNWWTTGTRVIISVHSVLLYASIAALYYMNLIGYNY